MKYANIIFDGNRTHSVNIGDDLQLLAIEHMYRKMGIAYEDVVRIPFSSLSNYDGEYVVLPVSFPLYGYRKDLYITMFSPKIIPVFLGLSIMSGNILPEEIEYLKRWQPILCRDYHSVELLRGNGIEAYINGCMTITLTTEILGQNICRVKPEKIYMVDVAEKYLDWIPKKIRDKAIERSQILHDCDNPEEEMKKVLMDYYENAALVITTRLHSAMPCIALGIPVVVIKDKYSFRFNTLSRYVPIYLEENHHNIDWNGSLINDGNEKMREMREKIMLGAIQRVKDTYKKYNIICDISQWYEEQNVDLNGYIEHFDNIKEFAEKKWGFDRNQSIEYAVWGITQKADLICSYMEDNFPNSKLVVVHDRSRKVSFHGIISTEDESLLLQENLFVFVTAATANTSALELFEKHKKDNYYISTDGVMDKKLQRKEGKINEHNNQ